MTEKRIKPKILLVDDAPTNIQMLAAILETDHKIIVAPNGRIALQMTTLHKPDLILLDIEMPELDGYQVCAKLKADVNTQGIPILFLTARDSEQDEVRGLSLGAIDYLTKPFNPTLVMARVKNHLELKRHQDTLEQITLALEMSNEIVEKAKKSAEKAKESAEKANRTKGEFLANMSHEIRTPMNSIIGFTDLMAQTPLTEKQHRYLDTIKSSGEHLLTVINDILDFSKIQAGKLILESIPFNLKHIIEQSVSHFSMLSQKKEITILHTLFPDVPTTLTGDPHRLRQILFNLLGNAVKFTQLGHIALFIRPLHQTNTEILLQFLVEDTGIGVTKKNQQKLFKPFSQSDSSNTRKYGGTGLGLSISAGLIQSMGGKMEMQSSEGIGSSFRFSLRFTPCLTPIPPTPNNLIEHTFNDKHHILVVEDDPVNLLFISELLKTLGFTEIDQAYTGKEALEMLEKASYDLILMDCQMPEMDGYQATKEIRQLEKTQQKPRLPIIALTANAMEDNRDKCLSVGMDDFLSKPIQIPLLARTMGKWLPHSKMIQSSSGVPQHNQTEEAKLEATDLQEEPLDQSGIEELKQLFGQANFSAVITAFLAEFPDKITRLEQAIENNDPEDLHKIAHILKGNTGMVKAVKLSQLFAKLVLLGRSGTTVGAHEMLPTVQEEKERVIKALERLIA